MKLSRIDQIALNGGDGAHYKYVTAAIQIMQVMHPSYNSCLSHKRDNYMIQEVVKILVEAFPND